MQQLENDCAIKLASITDRHHKEIKNLVRGSQQFLLGQEATIAVKFVQQRVSTRGIEKMQGCFAK